MPILDEYTVNSVVSQEIGELARKLERKRPLQFFRSVRNPRWWNMVIHMSFKSPGKRELMTT
jgi:hypothetical protein